MADDERKDWNNLSHQMRVEILGKNAIDQIVQDYAIRGETDAAFRLQLAREKQLWQPTNIKAFLTAGKPPSKEVVLGAWRDLDRSEALLELLDNSVDEWLRRRRLFKAKSAPELNIYIDFDAALGQLTYEDNAGGVSVDKLANLVVPGYSETTSLSPTIGSYKTGGKKAVFRLARAVQITTRYWSPAETSDDALTIQLDEQWINDSEAYEFPYTFLKDKSVIERGQTRYVLQLREEPAGEESWAATPEHVKKVTEQIRKTYTLLLIRHPNIHIFFLDRQRALEPLADLYEFSGAHDRGLDIRPQRVVFETALEYEGRKEPLKIEIVLGCRTSSGSRGGKTWGIDLYGNDRLFVPYDQQTFAQLLPQGGGKNLVRGYVNIRGPNVFIPWDTHKRHLNVDRDVMQVLTKHKLITDLFVHWRTAYNGIASGPVKVLIDEPFVGLIDRKRHDLVVPHTDEISLDVDKKRGKGVSLGNIFVPKVNVRKATNKSVQLKFAVTNSEARSLAAYYGVEGDLEASGTVGDLSAAIRVDVLKKARRS